MNRQCWISRSLVVVATLLLAAASTLSPNHRSTPAAFGCSSPPIGGHVGAFATCEECQFMGADGASQGVWFSWHCRLQGDGYYHLYAT